ncbi:unnamed protein product [Ixodes persulcatus]
MHSLWDVLMWFSLLVGSSTLISLLALDPTLVALMNAAIEVFLDMADVLVFVLSVEIIPTVVRSLGVFACYFYWGGGGGGGHGIGYAPRERSLLSQRAGSSDAQLRRPAHRPAGDLPPGDQGPRYLRHHKGSGQVDWPDQAPTV